MSEKVCTLSVDHAIRIAKIIATAPVARLPMITQLFHQASVDLEGLDELIQSSSLASQSQLVDTDEFIRDLTAGRELTPKGYLFTPDEFNRFCLDRNLQPRLVKRHLYAAGYIEATSTSRYPRTIPAVKELRCTSALSALSRLKATAPWILRISSALR